MDMVTVRRRSLRVTATVGRKRLTATKGVRGLTATITKLRARILNYLQSKKWTIA